MERQNKEGQQSTTPMVASDPGRSEIMFQALKRHIMRERQKKKEELEADAEVERQRKEIEAQRKQNVMTLGENREQISHLTHLLSGLKDEKHELFLKLKKLLNEEDVRRKQLVRQQESSSSEVVEVMGYSGIYSGLPPSQPPPLSVSGHISQLVMQPNYSVADRNTLYKVPPSHTLLPPGSMKRARSPSPPPPPQPSQMPPSSVYSQGFGQKLVSTRPSYQKSSSYGAYYAPPGTTGGNQTPYTFSSPQFASSSSRNEESVSQGKHPVYLPQPLPRASISQPYMHNSLEHKPPYTEETFFIGVTRPATHVPLHGGAIPIQAAQGVKTGGITSGFPIRPPSSAPPPPPHVASSPGSHSVYASQPPSGSRLVYSQAGPNRYGQREV